MISNDNLNYKISKVELYNSPTPLLGTNEDNVANSYHISVIMETRHTKL